MRYVFSYDDLEVRDHVRRVFDPQRLMNPGKVFPSDGSKPSHVPTPDGHPRRQPRTAVVAAGGGEGGRGARRPIPATKTPSHTHNKTPLTLHSPPPPPPPPTAQHP